VTDGVTQYAVVLPCGQRGSGGERRLGLNKGWPVTTCDISGEWPRQSDNRGSLLTRAFKR